MNSLLVWLIGLAAPIWRSLGADPRAVKLIVATKLKISDRTPRLTNTGKKKKKTSKWMEFFSYLLLLFIGCVTIFLAFQIEHIPTALGLGYGVTGIYLAMMMIMELSESIFDTLDVSVLLSRPIGDLTFSLARGLYVFTYAAKMVLAMTILPFIYLAVVAPVHAAVFFFGNTALTVVVTVGILSFYQFLLRKLSAQRFQQLLSTIQMVASGFFVALYLAPQIAGDWGERLAGLRLVGDAYGFVFPSFWLAAWHDLGAEATALSFVQALLGLVLFAFAIIIYRGQAQGYGASLLQLGGATAEAEEDATTITSESVQTGTAAASIGERLAHLFTRPGLERASFKFHWAMMLREKSFKGKVYPTLIFAPFFVVFFIIKDAFGEDTGSFSGSLIFGLYYMTMTVITPLGQARIIPEPEASWIWSVHPLPNRGPVAYGQYLASLSQFYLPTLLLTLPLFLYQGGVAFLPDIILAMGVAIVMGALYQMLEKTVPFSVGADGKKMGSIMAVVGVFAFSGFAGLAHYGLQYMPYGVWFGLAGAWLAALGSLYALRRVSGTYN